jgi:hypothetical protein
MKMRGFFDLGCCIKLAEHAGVSLRLHRALQSRVEAPLFRKPLQKCEGFFDLGCCIKLAEHAGVPLRLHRALQSRIEAPLFNKALHENAGLFWSRAYEVNGTR